MPEVMSFENLRSLLRRIAEQRELPLTEMPLREQWELPLRKREVVYEGDVWDPLGFGQGGGFFGPRRVAGGRGGGYGGGYGGAVPYMMPRDDPAARRAAERMWQEATGGLQETIDRYRGGHPLLEQGYPMLQQVAAGEQAPLSPEIIANIAAQQSDAATIAARRAKDALRRRLAGLGGEIGGSAGEREIEGARQQTLQRGRTQTAIGAAVENWNARMDALRQMLAVPFREAGATQPYESQLRGAQLGREFTGRAGGRYQPLQRGAQRGYRGRSWQQ